TGARSLHWDGNRPDGPWPYISVNRTVGEGLAFLSRTLCRWSGSLVGATRCVALGASAPVVLHQHVATRRTNLRFVGDASRRPYERPNLARCCKLFGRERRDPPLRLLERRCPTLQALHTTG